MSRVKRDRGENRTSGVANSSHQQQGEDDQQQQQQQQQEKPPQVPMGDRNLLACRSCRKILDEGQFIVNGCADCNDGGLGKGEELQDDTTPKFKGFVGIIAAKHSWVARMMGCVNAPIGVYATYVEPREGGDDRDEDEGEEGGEGEGDAEEQEEEEGGEQQLAAEAAGEELELPF